jgi:UDP-2,3-diacylglucosamine pyrophosphatase LpxH
MHERLLASLESVADVRLVAALRHERLGFPNGKDLRVFTGDVHLISEKRLIEGEFTYATNHPKLLTSVVAALAELRSQAAQDETVEVYQLGDLLDLWREAPRPDQQPDVPARIKDDHEDLITAFLDRRLGLHFLLGNHDLDLCRWPDYAGWERRYYLPDAAPGVVVLHGDYFDWVERLPASIQEIFVYLFAAGVAPNDYVLGRMRALSLESHAGRDYRRQIQLAQAAPIGPLRPPRADGIPPEWNVQREGVADIANLRFLDSAYRECLKANREFGLNLKVAVIGHTHHARIAVREAGDGGLFTLIDCGAWIENCRAQDGAGSSPNAQIAALSAGEARIYQLAPKPITPPVGVPGAA